jgi:LytS/YehU family sensor histidine kinase
MESQELISGWNAGCNNELDNNKVSLEFSNRLIVGLFASLFILPILWIIYLLGNIHYYLLFNPILSKSKTENYILYIILSLVLYQGILKTFFFVDVLNIFDWKAEAYSGLIWAFSLAGALLISFNENKEKQTAQEIQKQKLEIKALKAQINPHFLFNTLNNLMGTAISENAPQTSLQIQQLAGIMRHVVEETQAEYTPIEKELKFLGDYIELMQLRVPKEENIRINVRIDFDENSFLISPLILITFIENAFKYGISINQACFVDILLTIENKKIDLVCKNSIVNVENSTETGLESVKKRLELTYPQQHSLEISTENNVFEVVFKLDLSHENPTV